MGPNNTKKCDFIIFNYEYYCQNLASIVKKHQFLSRNCFFALCQNQEWAHKQQI
jgi:hypothetical protein